MVGTSGDAGMRADPLTARGLILPALMSASDDDTSTTPILTLPFIKSPRICCMPF